MEKNKLNALMIYDSVLVHLPDLADIALDVNDVVQDNPLQKPKYAPKRVGNTPLVKVKDKNAHPIYHIFKIHGTPANVRGGANQIAPSHGTCRTAGPLYPGAVNGIL